MAGESAGGDGRRLSDLDRQRTSAAQIAISGSWPARAPVAEKSWPEADPGSPNIFRGLAFAARPRRVAGPGINLGTPCFASQGFHAWEMAMSIRFLVFAAALMLALGACTGGAFNAGMPTSGSHSGGNGGGMGGGGNGGGGY